MTPERPPSIVDALDRHAFLRLGMIAVGASCVVFAAARLFTELDSGRLTPWWCNALGAVAMTIVWFWYRRRPDRRATAAVHLTGAVALIALLVPVPYGMSSSIWWLSLVGFAMALMGTRREAVIWFVVVLLAVLGAKILEPHVQIANAAGEPPVERLLAAVVFAAVLLSLAIGFRGVVERRTVQLNAARAEAQAALAARTRFLSHVSHELRTPLHGVIAMLDLVANETLQPPTDHRIRTAQASADLLLGLLEDLLDVARFDTREMIRAEPFDLHATIQTVALSLAQVAKTKDLAFSATAEPGLLAQRLGDRRRVAQMATNLISNAIKFTGEGSVDVRLSSGETAEQLVLTVCDTGPGIPAERLEDIFAPFIQAKEATPQRGAGLGLGLSITRSLARRMGGDVSAISTLGVGSEFRLFFVLPIVEGAEPGPIDLLSVTPPKMGDDAAGAPGLSARAPLRCLVADDDPVNRLVAEQCLRALGHRTQVAADGEAAWNLLLGSDFDVLLTDLEMPVLNGLELARRIREKERREPRSRLRIAALTAHATQDWQERILDAGIDAVLTKPFTIAQIRGVLESPGMTAPKPPGP